MEHSTSRERIAVVLNYINHMVSRQIHDQASVDVGLWPLYYNVHKHVFIPIWDNIASVRTILCDPMQSILRIYEPL
jgi:hypothetical protein